MRTDKDLDIINTMRKFGGSFVQALAEAALRADDDNLNRLKKAFPELWNHYDELMSLDRKDIG